MTMERKTLLSRTGKQKYLLKKMDIVLDKVKEKFTKEEQEWYLTGFKSFLEYDPLQDFVIDLDDVWEWIGFNRINAAKRLLTKHFKEGDDYKILDDNGAKEETRGGHNKERILMNVNTFKKLCLKSNTKKADRIYDYYIKLESLQFETLQEKIEQIAYEKQQELNKVEYEKREELKRISSNNVENLYKYKDYIRELEDKNKKDNQLANKPDSRLEKEMILAEKQMKLLEIKERDKQRKENEDIKKLKEDIKKLKEENKKLKRKN